MMGSFTRLVPIGRRCLLAIRRPADARDAHFFSGPRVQVYNRRALKRPACHRGRRASGKNESAMNIPVISPGLILVSTLFLATPGFARNKNDVVVMNNGDRLTCEIKGLDDGVLSVSLDYVDGTVSLQWSKVGRLESAQKFIIRTTDGSVQSGTLLSTEAVAAQPMKIQIEEKGAKIEVVEARQVVKITQTSERFWQRFNGAIDFGIDHSKGNDATQYSLGAETSYIRERWAAMSSFNSNLSANSGSTTSTRQQVDISAYRFLPWNNYFYEGIGSFLQSSVQGITLQTSLGGGIGRFFKNTNRVTIAVTGARLAEHSLSAVSCNSGPERDGRSDRGGIQGVQVQENQPKPHVHCVSGAVGAGPCALRHQCILLSETVQQSLVEHLVLRKLGQ
jgi:hypothetical protein